MHTGDSITVAPAQTLTNKEYQVMRDASLAVLRKIGVDTGGSNVQFAINPVDGRMVIIEMNLRVSRSSALASKATGFPIAKVAAKLAVGYTLDELRNEITGGATPASFEPTIDYVVTKVPRFTFEKFPTAEPRLTTQMKSVGEVMAIGRSFEEALQKAIRMLQIGMYGFVGNENYSFKNLEKELFQPTDERLFGLAEAFKKGWTVEKVASLTKIDPWFLYKMKGLVELEEKIRKYRLDDLPTDLLLEAKKKGFSDKQLAIFTRTTEEDVREKGKPQAATGGQTN